MRQSEKTKTFSKITLLLIPIGIAVNVVGGQIPIALKIPLFIDSIGTFVVGALCGPIPGALVGLLTNTINAITAPTVFFYAILNVLFGLIAGFIGKKGWLSSIPKALLAGLVVGFISANIAVPITMALGGYGGQGNSLLIAGFMAAGWGFVPSIYVGEIIGDVADKLLTMVIVYFILKSMPQRFLSKMPQGQNFIRKASIEETDETPGVTTDEKDID